MRIEKKSKLDCDEHLAKSFWKKNEKPSLRNLVQEHEILSKEYSSRELV